jgi:DNA primase
MVTQRRPDPSGETPRWSIDEVLARTDLAALLDTLTPSTGRAGPGRRWHCPVPDHVDHRPSVTIHRDHHGHERWRCWSGPPEHRGDAVDLIRTTRGLSTVEAVEWLAQRAGMFPNHPLPPPRPVTPRPPPAGTLDPRVETYVRLCASVLRGSQGEPMRRWLTARGISPAIAQANLVGADPGRTLMRRTRGLPYGAGPGVTFPALDPAGRIAYVQTRYLDPDTAGRKYDNPSQTLAPHPRLAFTRTSGEPSDRAGLLVVTEGLPDALIAADAGFNSVALLGAQTPDAGVAARLTTYATSHRLEIALVVDADDAGRRATDTLARLLHADGITLHIAACPEGQDLNDWALADQNWSHALDRLTTPTATPHLGPVHSASIGRDGPHPQERDL